MAEIEKKPVKIVETILRDAHQSLIATRMTTDQMMPIVDKMDKVGYHAVECWGGATFDASLRFLKEDPWERLRKFRDGFKNTKLQMLFRGQNILGYRPYADDVVEYFVQKSVANGIDIIRIFDCLNDMRNLQTAVTAANKEKAHAQVAMSYTLGDAYTLEYWVDLAKRIEDMGASSICVKDMAGLLVPYQATELVTALKEAVSIPIEMHTHYTSGVASMTYLKSVEAGADIIDTAMSPFALGTSQPATEVMVETFKGTPYDTGLDQNLLAVVFDYEGNLWFATGGFRIYPDRKQQGAMGYISRTAIDAILNGDVDAMMSLVPDNYLDYMIETYDIDEDAVKDELQTLMEDELADWEDDYGANIELTVKCNDEEVAEQSEIDDLNDELEESGWDFTITEGYTYSVDVTFNGDDDEYTETYDDVAVLKVDGKWFNSDAMSMITDAATEAYYNS
mgnify:CR=1 FL=1